MLIVGTCASECVGSHASVEILLTSLFEELKYFLESAAPLHRGTRRCSSVLETPAVNKKTIWAKKSATLIVAHVG